VGRRAVWTIVAGLGGILAVGGWGVYATTAPGPLKVDRDVVVAKGNGAAIAESLLRDQVISQPLVFRLAAVLTRGDGALRAAEFHIPRGASVRQVLWILRHGKPVLHLVTFPEGITAARIAQILAQNDALSGDVVVPPEGYILPQTYAFARGTERDEIISRAHQALLKYLTPLPPGMSAREILILASLVERESALDRERPLVARVFLNRLQLGMKLQSDPTAIYGLAGGDFSLGRALTRDDLKRDDPYNTYFILALPAGPICAAGASSIEAVLHPADSDALYFVADGSGGHVFARSLSDHSRNVARYRAQKEALPK